eukprot:CCRYP_016542-RA/>CCRYP_016542-RA protein AED:0.32 eAED:0.32 QI:98/1/1/1/0/0/2/34/67
MVAITILYCWLRECLPFFLYQMSEGTVIYLYGRLCTLSKQCSNSFALTFLVSVSWIQYIVLVFVSHK